MPTPESPLDADSEASTFLHELRVSAMATEFVILLPHATSGRQLDQALSALQTVQAMEQQLSIYQAGSDVSRINALAGEPVRVCQDVVDVLLKAAELAEKTSGAFDVTAGPLIEAWGFTRRRGRKPSAEEIERARSFVDWRNVQVDASQRTVRLAKPGMQVNLGAIGKGFAIDHVCDQLTQLGVEHFLVHGGNSTLAARGNSDGDASAGSSKGWVVGVQHPSRPEHRLGTILLQDASMSTSGPGKQFFHFRGKRFGHVIDPRSGWPAGDLESLTVLAPTAAESDALATGWFVEGQEIAMQAADAMHRPLYCIRSSDRQGGVEVLFAGGAEWAG